ncbi:hypothetical protein I316_06862 [Kwoniella heveanensis BCC8398]|uniref:Uncharacterized protein n=1 Tax=Kwoniella heveanensis BCC8398 TaxID=1296120 RepID=A0A1B9GK86_9TREE|nr:hypothetical protein I316_06862 [Kwoniella heveanensis BCC8398]
MSESIVAEDHLQAVEERERVHPLSLWPKGQMAPKPRSSSRSTGAVVLLSRAEQERIKETGRIETRRFTAGEAKTDVSAESKWVKTDLSPSFAVAVQGQESKDTMQGLSYATDPPVSSLSTLMPDENTVMSALERGLARPRACVEYEHRHADPGIDGVFGAYGERAQTRSCGGNDRVLSALIIVLP